MMAVMAMVSCPWVMYPCRVLRTACVSEENNSSKADCDAFISVTSWKSWNVASVIMPAACSNSSGV